MITKEKHGHRMLFLRDQIMLDPAAGGLGRPRPPQTLEEPLPRSSSNGTSCDYRQEAPAHDAVTGNDFH
jgi:hypothetical protein